MAQITLSSGSFPRPYRSALGPDLIRHFQESTAVSTAVIKIGDIVSNDTVVSTGGFRIVRAPFNGGGGTNLLNTTNVVGIAAEGSTSDGSTTGLASSGTDRRRYLAVWLADPNVEFIGNLKDGSGLPNASSMIGLTRAVIYDSTLGIYCIDSTNSTAALASVRITDVPFGEAGDTNGRVVFKFLSTGVSPAI